MQQEQIDSIHVRLAQVSSRLQELQNRRDVLNARLNAAERGRKEGSRRRAARGRLLASGVAALVAFAVIAAITWQKLQDGSETTAELPTDGTALPAQSSCRSESNRHLSRRSAGTGVRGTPESRGR